MDRAFSSWQLGAPGENPTASDYTKLEIGITHALRRVGGYPNPTREGVFDPKSVKSSYLSRLDNNVKVKMISDMAGLLFYRALPLTTAARNRMGPTTSPPPPTPTSNEVSEASVSFEVFQQVESTLGDTKSKLDAARVVGLSSSSVTAR